MDVNDLEQDTAAGWYPDPEPQGGVTAKERYWDGAQWTDRRRPILEAGKPGGPKRAPAVWSGGMGTRDTVLLSFFVPLAGFILGVMEMTRHRASQGVVLLLVGFVGLLVWWIVLASVLVNT